MKMCRKVSSYFYFFSSYVETQAGYSEPFGFESECNKWYVNKGYMVRGVVGMILSTDPVSLTEGGGSCAETRQKVEKHLSA